MPCWDSITVSSKMRFLDPDSICEQKECNPSEFWKKSGLVSHSMRYALSFIQKLRAIVIQQYAIKHCFNHITRCSDTSIYEFLCRKQGLSQYKHYHSYSETAKTQLLHHIRHTLNVSAISIHARLSFTIQRFVCISHGRSRQSP